MHTARILGTTILFFIMLFTLTAFAVAVEAPSFPSCIAPQGSLKVKYDNGIHGIVGDQREFRGEDSVYTLTSETLLQCFCPLGGDGIQTNWWKVSHLTSSDIGELESQGWILVADGSVWGLDKAPYLAKNLNFKCRPIGGGASVGTASNGSGGGSSSGSSGGSAVGGALQTVGEVLGLAATGTLASDIVFILSGISILALGFLLKKFKTKHDEQI